MDQCTRTHLRCDDQLHLYRRNRRPTLSIYNTPRLTDLLPCSISPSPQSHRPRNPEASSFSAPGCWHLPAWFAAHWPPNSLTPSLKACELKGPIGIHVLVGPFSVCLLKHSDNRQWRRRHYCGRLTLSRHLLSGTRVTLSSFEYCPRSPLADGRVDVNVAVSG